MRLCSSHGSADKIIETRDRFVSQWNSLQSDEIVNDFNDVAYIAYQIIQQLENDKRTDKQNRTIDYETLSNECTEILKAIGDIAEIIQKSQNPKISRFLDACEGMQNAFFDKAMTYAVFSELERIHNSTNLAEDCKGYLLHGKHEETDKYDCSDAADIGRKAQQILNRDFSKNHRLIAGILEEIVKKADSLLNELKHPDQCKDMKGNPISQRRVFLEALGLSEVLRRVSVHARRQYNALPKGLTQYVDGGPLLQIPKNLSLLEELHAKYSALYKM